MLAITVIVKCLFYATPVLSSRSQLAFPLGHGEFRDPELGLCPRSLMTWHLGWQSPLPMVTHTGRQPGVCFTHP